MNFLDAIQANGFYAQEMADENTEVFSRGEQYLVVNPREIVLYDNNWDQIWSLKTRRAALKRLAQSSTNGRALIDVLAEE